MGGNVRGRRTKRAECPRHPSAVRAPRTNSAGCPRANKNTPGVRWRRTEGALEHTFDHSNKYTIVPLIVTEFGITSTLLSVPFPE